MTKHDMPELTRLLAFLELEFRMQFRDKAEMFQRPLAERVDEGVAIDGMRVVDSVRLGPKNQPVTVFETNRVNSKFRSGDYFYCHPQDDGVDLITAMNAYGQVALKNRKILSMSADRRTIHLPGQFSSDTKWCLDELPSERFPLTTYPCLMAGVTASECETGQKVQRWLRLGGDVQPFSSGVSDCGPAELTRTQRQSLYRALHDEISLIQGPPGTGKTFLIAEIIEQVMQENPAARILVCCFSHTAIDNVLRAVHSRNPEIPRYRIGRRLEDPDLPPETIEAGEHLFATRAGIWGMTAFKAAGPWTRALGTPYREHLRQQRERGCLIDDSAPVEAIEFAWRQAQLPSSNEFFDLLIVDEASQMTVPTALMAMVHGSRCILVGDEKQLPPVAQSDPPFAPSVFDHMIDVYEEQRSVMLDVTHRMNQEICSSPSKLFYDRKLKSRVDIRKRRIAYPRQPIRDASRPDWLTRVLDPHQPILFLSIDHDTGDDSSHEEASVVAKIVAEMLATGMTHEEGLAVVCAHRKQNGLVRRLTSQAVNHGFPGAKIDVDGLISDTVERIQGQQRDAIIVSLTGSDPNHLTHQWTFSHCPRRFNVSITRPKSKLIVVGSPRFFHFSPDTGHGETLDRLKGITALKRWYLDRLDQQQIVELVPSEA